jgi:hypothetical protein
LRHTVIVYNRNVKTVRAMRAWVVGLNDACPNIRCILCDDASIARFRKFMPNFFFLKKQEAGRSQYRSMCELQVTDSDKFHVTYLTQTTCMMVVFEKIRYS